MTKKSNLIRNILSDRVKAVTYDNNAITINNFANVNFNIQIPIEFYNINTQELRKIKFLEINLINNSLFDDQFLNDNFSDISRTGSFKYRKISSENKENKVLKTQLKYNSSFIKDESFNKIVDFNLENFKNNSNIYTLTLDNNFSKSVFAKKTISNIKISLLDEDQNIVDTTSFFDIDLSHQFIKINTENLGLDYYDIFWENIKDKIKLDYVQLNQEIEKINVTGRENLLLDISKNSMFNEDNGPSFLRINFVNYNVIIEKLFKSPEGVEFLNIKGIILKSDNEESFTEFCQKIARDHIIGTQEFVFNVILSLGDKYLTQEIILDRNNSFITSIAYKYVDVSKAIILNDISDRFFAEPAVTDGVSEEIFDKIEISCRLRQIVQSEEVANKILNTVRLKSIKNNSKELDYIYTDKSFNLESRIDYKNISLSNLFSKQNNSLNFWIRLSQINANLTFEFSLLDSTLLTSPFNISNTNFTNYFIQNRFNNINKIFKENIKFNEENLPRLPLISTQFSLFNLRNISFSNIEYLNDIAFNFGYVENNSIDITSMLENCVLRLKKATKINEIPISSKEIQCFFFELFSIDTIQSDVIYSNNNFIESNLHTNDLFNLELLVANSRLDSKIKDFLMSETDESNSSVRLPMSISASELSESFLLENKLEIQILPLPKIIANNIGRGIINLENGEIKPNIENRDEISIAFTELMYNQNQNISSETVLRIKRSLFRNFEDSVYSANIFSELFDIIIDSNVENINKVVLDTRYTKDEILNIYGSEDLINIFKQRTLVSGALRHHDVNVDDSEIFIINFPYNLSYDDAYYDTEENCYKPTGITINKNNATGNIRFDNEIINRLSLYYNSVLRLKTFASFRFLMTNEEGIISDSLVNEFNSSLEPTSRFRILKAFYIDTQVITTLDKNYLTSSRTSDVTNYFNSINRFLSNFFEFCKTNKINIIKDIVYRVSLANSYPTENLRAYTLVRTDFSHKIPKVNLNNQIIKIDNLQIANIKFEEIN
jgi:hypothetical protein